MCVCVWEKEREGCKEREGWRERERSVRQKEIQLRGDGGLN